MNKIPEERMPVNFFAGGGGGGGGGGGTSGAGRIGGASKETGVAVPLDEPLDVIDSNPPQSNCLSPMRFHLISWPNRVNVYI